ncbi:MAG: ABC transporter ATP-binding protein [Chlamydiota bacterium]
MHTTLQEEPALQIYQLSVNYDKTPVLWDVTMEIPKGKLVGIIGPNGAGKSTFIKTVLGLIPPLSGKVSFLGKPLKKMRKRVAYVPQRETVDWDFPITVRNLVLMGRYGRLGLLRWPRKADWAAADHYLESVGMLQFADRQISQLSGGQQQRVFIARALLQEADIYFLDEPLAGIDKASEKVIIDIIKKLRDKGKTVFVVHHDLNTAENFFDWAILLNMRLVAYGPMSEVFIPQKLNTTYGKNYSLFDEAVKLSQQKTRGMDRH